jgi:hypothetical protein
MKVQDERVLSAPAATLLWSFFHAKIDTDGTNGKACRHAPPGDLFCHSCVFRADFPRL